MVALTEKGRIRDWINNTLKNLREGIIKKEDMEHLAKPKYQEHLHDKGYGYLHDFAKAYLKDSEAEYDKQKYQGKTPVKALELFLSEHLEPENLISKFDKEEYKAIFQTAESKHIKPTPSITMAPAATYSKTKEREAGNFGRPGSDESLIEKALEVNPNVTEEQVIEFATKYPLLSGIFHAKDVYQSQDKRNIAFAVITGDKQLESEYKNLKQLQDSVRQIAFDPNLKEEQKDRLLKALNDKAHIMYNSGQLGIPKPQQDIPKELTQQQQENLASNIKEKWDKVKARKSLEAQGMSGEALKAAVSAASPLTRKRSGGVLTNRPKPKKTIPNPRQTTV